MAHGDRRGVAVGIDQLVTLQTAQQNGHGRGDHGRIRAGAEGVNAAVEQIGYIATAYYYQSAAIVAKTAAILGKSDDAARYDQLAQEIKAALGREYFTPNGRLALDTQTAYALALHMDFAPEESRERLAARLLEKLRAKGGYLQTGFVGTPILTQSLSDHGCTEMAYKLLLNEDYPSWLYAVNLGATTVWERWNSVLPDGHFGATDMNSLNHYAYGSIVGWMYSSMAGLRLQEEHPGFARVTIAPQPDWRIRCCDMEYRSAAGVYAVHWQIEQDGGFALRVKIPFGAEADIVLPNHDGETVHALGGEHEFCYTPDPPFRKQYSIASPLAELLESPAARELVAALLPRWDAVPLPLRELPLTQLTATPFAPLDDEQLEALDASLKKL